MIMLKQQNGTLKPQNKGTLKHNTDWHIATTKERECHKTTQKQQNGTLKPQNKGTLKHKPT